MKFTINIFLSFILLIVFSSCEETLTEEPKDFISPSNFYQDTQDAEMALAGAYSSSFLNDNFLNLNRHHAEYTIARGSYTSVGNYNVPINADQFGRIAGAWSDLYTTINRANVVLANVPEIEGMDSNTQTRILAEAHFLRAWSYWDLLQTWGPVPLRLEEFTGTTPVEAPRASRQEVYNQIISDLQTAEQGLPSDVGNEIGRASRWAAKMMLAQVYLDMENWGAAAEKAEEVIQSGNYSLIQVNEPQDFYNIFATSFNSEYIFAWQATVNRSYNHLNWYHGSDNVFNKGSVWGFTMLVDYDVPLIQNWDDDDLRKEFNIYDHHTSIATGEVVPNDPQTKYRFGKFIKDDAGNATHSVPVLRYAEAFLIYAEAANMAEGGPSALALERLNTIRRRGYGYDPYSTSPVDIAPGMTQNEFHDRVIQERAYELFFEDDRRFWDLKRNDMIQEVFEAAGKPFTTDRLLYPIPQQEIDTNPGIGSGDQNPGY